MELSAVKSQMLELCKSRWRLASTAQYSWQDQINAALGIEEEPGTIKAFVQQRQSDFVAISEAIDKLKSVDVIADFANTSDADMCKYIDSSFSGLSTDEQKLTIAMAIQVVKEKLRESELMAAEAEAKRGA